MPRSLKIVTVLSLAGWSARGVSRPRRQKSRVCTLYAGYSRSCLREVEAGDGDGQFGHWKGATLEERLALADDLVSAAATAVHLAFYPNSSSDIRRTACLLPGHRCGFWVAEWLLSDSGSPTRASDPGRKTARPLLSADCPPRPVGKHTIVAN